MIYCELGVCGRFWFEFGFLLICLMVVLTCVYLNRFCILPILLFCLWVIIDVVYLFVEICVLF